MRAGGHSSLKPPNRSIASRQAFQPRIHSVVTAIRCSEAYMLAVPGKRPRRDLGGAFEARHASLNFLMPSAWWANGPPSFVTTNSGRAFSSAGMLSAIFPNLCVVQVLGHLGQLFVPGSDDIPP